MAHVGGDGGLTTLHMVTAYLGVLIGGITFTGSLVAFMKLAGRMSVEATPAPRSSRNQLGPACL